MFYNIACMWASVVLNDFRGTGSPHFCAVACVGMSAVLTWEGPEYSCCFLEQRGGWCHMLNSIRSHRSHELCFLHSTWSCNFSFYFVILSEVISPYFAPAQFILNKRKHCCSSCTYQWSVSGGYFSVVLEETIIKPTHCSVKMVLRCRQAMMV